MHLFRVPVAWSGPSVVGLAVNVLHFDGTNQTEPPVAAIAAAYGQIANNLPSGTKVQVPGSGDIIDDTTGNLAGTWSATQPAVVTGGSVTESAAGVGACVSWTTGGLVTGAGGKSRRLRGRTFLVPFHANCYAGDGTLGDQYLANTNAFADALMQAGGFFIWHRQTTKGGSDGTSAAVASRKVADRVAFMSSRRS